MSERGRGAGVDDEMVGAVLVPGVSMTRKLETREADRTLRADSRLVFRGGRRKVAQPARPPMPATASRIRAAGRQSAWRPRPRRKREGAAFIFAERAGAARGQRRQHQHAPETIKQARAEPPVNEAGRHRPEAARERAKGAIHAQHAALLIRPAVERHQGRGGRADQPGARPQERRARHKARAGVAARPVTNWPTTTRASPASSTRCSP